MIFTDAASSARHVSVPTVQSTRSHVGSAGLFEPNELGCSDLPWSMAWDGDRRTIWLPMTIDEFYQISDFVAPNSVQFALLSHPLYARYETTEAKLSRSEYKGWASQCFKVNSRADFPLKAFMAPTPDHILLADRARWAKKPTEEAPPGTAQPLETSGTNAPAPSADSTNQLAVPSTDGAKPAP